LCSNIREQLLFWCHLDVHIYPSYRKKIDGVACSVLSWPLLLGLHSESNLKLVDGTPQLARN
jgi:hypothetical protein